LVMLIASSETRADEVPAGAEPNISRSPATADVTTIPVKGDGGPIKFDVSAYGDFFYQWQSARNLQSGGRSFGAKNGMMNINAA
ncbi:hypothetical protein ABTF56_20795, partial [Acinetobacter baumannii]